MSQFYHYQYANYVLIKTRMLCVTRTATAKKDAIRSYESQHRTQENYVCNIWEACSASAAAPIFFRSVKFQTGGERWCDGGLHRNNPILEALAEAGREWGDKTIGCVLSIGTGVPVLGSVPDNLPGFLKESLSIMTDAEKTAVDFIDSKEGQDLSRSGRYFRFSVPQGMHELRLDDYKEIERMKAVTTLYLSNAGSGHEVERCAKALLYPEEISQ